MTHSTGVYIDSYYRATEAEILEDYLKAVDFLTVDNQQHRLQKEVADISEKANEENHIIKAKLQERDNDIAELKDAVAYLTNKINAAIISNEPSCKITSNEKGIPKAIEFSAIVGKAISEIAK
jgi:hypothetical protein